MTLFLFYGVFQDDEVFTFNFNLIGTHEGEEVIYALNKTCSPSLPWSPREVTCEGNYMEVSLGIFLNITSQDLFKILTNLFSVGVCEE